MHHEMRQGIIVLGLYPCFTSGKDNEKTNTFQIFPDYFIKTLLWGLTPAVSFQKILYFGAWPQHLNLISGPDPRGKFTTHERYQKQAAATTFMEKECGCCYGKTSQWGLIPDQRSPAPALLACHHRDARTRSLIPDQRSPTRSLSPL